MKIRIASMLIVLGLAASSSGCFGLFGGGSPEYTATLVVRNDLVPPAAVTVVLRQGDADQETLGTIAADQERTLSYTSRDLQGTYQLVARLTTGASVSSREFTLFDGAQVRWQVRSNTLSVTQR
jgi:hypothetical protein